MQNAKIVFIVRLAEAIDLGYASQNQFDETVSKILNRPVMFPLTAHVEVLGVYKRGIVASKGKTRQASLISTPSDADADTDPSPIFLTCTVHIRSASLIHPTVEDLFHRRPAHLSVRATHASQRHLSPSCLPICSSLSSHFWGSESFGQWWVKCPSLVPLTSCLPEGA